MEKSSVMQPKEYYKSNEQRPKLYSEHQSISFFSCVEGLEGNISFYFTRSNKQIKLKARNIPKIVEFDCKPNLNVKYANMCDLSGHQAYWLVLASMRSEVSMGERVRP